MDTLVGLPYSMEQFRVRLQGAGMLFQYWSVPLVCPWYVESYGHATGTPKYTHGILE